MVVRMRVNRSKTGKRRSHHALVAASLAVCECGAPRVSHRACAECGKYNGKVVIDVVARAKREARRDKKKQKELRAAGQEKDTTNSKEEAKTT
ncbi:50S ribosomal protein L32 [Candidatus Kaiserbacteria bacterium]|nr:50S ribosomal protein L32 [Candidatus Kaiserbacteria bacterium]